MEFTRQEVLNLANLSRLSLTEEEIVRYQSEIPSILEYVGKLSEVDTSSVAPMTGGVSHAVELRDDEAVAQSEESRRAIINEFPESAGDLLKVKTILTNKKMDSRPRQARTGLRGNDGEVARNDESTQGNDGSV
ncbi:MAG: Asp-tRNA(Asn)/Glu-tRNA(Gln) amidotransferase subunit GatC [bacterium]